MRAKARFFLLLLLPACMPPSWAAGALLHPGRQALTVARPARTDDVEVVSDRVKLRGWHMHPAGRARGTLVYLHGVASNRGSVVSIAQPFLDRGFEVLAFDSRAHGESGGDACTYGWFEKQDLARIIDTAAVRPIVVLGTSLGAAVALQAAAEDERIAAVISVATFADLRSVATERAPFFASQSNIRDALTLAEQQGHFKVDDVSPVEAARRIQRPVLVIHGADDDETRPEHSRRVYGALTGKKKLLLTPGAKHNNAIDAAAWAEIGAWADAALRP